MTPDEEQELQELYASDPRRYRDEDVVDKYDTKGEYSHSENIQTQYQNGN